MDDIEQIQKFLIKFYVAFYKLNQVHKCVLVMETVKKKNIGSWREQCRCVTLLVLVNMLLVFRRINSFKVSPRWGNQTKFYKFSCCSRILYITLLLHYGLILLPHPHWFRVKKCILNITENFYYFAKINFEKLRISWFSNS